MLMKVNKLFLLFNLILFASILVYVLWPANHSEDIHPSSSLQLVTIIFRHGARAPDQTFPNDPHTANEEYWPDGLGQLLLKGKEEMFTLGTTFRERYKDFIPKYVPDEVRVRSSDFDRTHMSAAALLAGWFPPEDEQVWSDELLWQPIPIHSVPISQDSELAYGCKCPRFDSELSRVESEARRNESKEDAWVREYIKENSGGPVDYKSLARYYITFRIEESLGLKLSNWTQKVYPEKMRKMYHLMMHLLFWNDEMTRLFSGPMLSEILQQLKKKTGDGNYRKKLFLYSSHDISLIGLTKALGFSLEEVYRPLSFGTSLILELHKSSSDDYYVKVYYLDRFASTEPILLNIPNCPNPCPFANLYNNTEYMRTVDIMEDCKLK